MPLSPEITASLMEKAAAERRAEGLAKIARQQAEEADKPRVNSLAAEINATNIQLHSDRQLREGLQLHIKNDRRKMEYHANNDIITGLPIAQTYSHAVVLTPEGIRAFAIHHQITFENRGTPSFAAKNEPLKHENIREFLPPKGFPSPDALRQRIEALLDIS